MFSLSPQIEAVRDIQRLIEDSMMLDVGGAQFVFAALRQVKAGGLEASAYTALVAAVHDVAVAGKAAGSGWDLVSETVWPRAI